MSQTHPAALPPEARGIAFPQNPHYDKLHYLLRSRKFWAAVIAIAFIAIGPRAGIDQHDLTAAVITIIGYILGTALEDGLRS